MIFSSLTTCEWSRDSKLKKGQKPSMFSIDFSPSKTYDRIHFLDRKIAPVERVAVTVLMDK
jgi:hypothetical protein